VSVQPLHTTTTSISPGATPPKRASRQRPMTGASLCAGITTDPRHRSAETVGFRCAGSGGFAVMPRACIRISFRTGAVTDRCLPCPMRRTPRSPQAVPSREGARRDLDRACRNSSLVASRDPLSAIPHLRTRSAYARPEGRGSSVVPRLARHGRGSVPPPGSGAAGQLAGRWLRSTADGSLPLPPGRR
jgi:hypothetical protein